MKHRAGIQEHTTDLLTILGNPQLNDTRVVVCSSRPHQISNIIDESGRESIVILRANAYM